MWCGMSTRKSSVPDFYAASCVSIRSMVSGQWSVGRGWSLAERLDCVRLPGAFPIPPVLATEESGSKLHALHTLREVRWRLHGLGRCYEFDQGLATSAPTIF